MFKKSWVADAEIVRFKDGNYAVQRIHYDWWGLTKTVKFLVEGSTYFLRPHDEMGAPSNSIMKTLESAVSTFDKYNEDAALLKERVKFYNKGGIPFKP